MKIRVAAAVFAPALAFGLAACDVHQTREGELPEVEVEGGQLPEYEVEGPEIEIDRDTVVVPDVDINPPPDTSPTA